ncbi:MAG: hypothetical protein KGZ25_15095, partial [Planctomycetes bacterium]|nr:hypothetical protein [Planctomycetota bacterium]
ENSMRPVSVQEPHFEVAEVFKDASYADRYQILCERLLRKRLYDGACFLLSKREEGLQGNYREPHQELTFKNFASHLIAHVEGYLRSHGRNGTEGNQA